jgi:TRAP-type uncharacterized transport system substrate-binding protein
MNETRRRTCGVALALLAAIVAVLGACAPAAAGAVRLSSSAPAGPPVAAPSVVASAPTGLTLLTGSPTGGIHAYGSAFAALAEREVAGLSMTVEATSGSYENLFMLLAGSADVAMSSGDVLAAAIARTDRFADLPPGVLHVLAAIASGDSNVYVVVRADMTDEVAYALTQVLIERDADLAGRARTAGEAAEERTLTIAVDGVTLHPGSVSYLEDAGFVVPAALRGG